MEERNELIIMCSCGCGNGFIFKYYGDLIYVSSIHGYFYSAQRSIRGFFETKFRMLFKKDAWILGACVDRDTAEELIGFLKSVRCCDDGVSNAGKIVLSDCLFEEESYNDFYLVNEEYELLLYSTLSKREILHNKEYRAGEIILNEDKRISMINGLESVLYMHDKRKAELEKKIDSMSEIELFQTREAEERKMRIKSKMDHLKNCIADVFWTVFFPASLLLFLAKICRKVFGRR